MKGSVGDFCLYLAVRLAVTVIQALSVTTARRLGQRIGELAWRCDRRHRRIAVENLEAAFPGQWPPPQREALVRRTFQHFAVMFTEVALLPRVFRLRQWRRYVRLVGHGPVLRLLLERRRFLLLTGHFGNWEMVGYALGAYGFPVYAVARPLDNPYLEDFLARFRQKTGQTLIAKRGGLEAMAAALTRGEALGVIGDQDAGSRGVFVDFFGRPASTHKALGLTALTYDLPIVVGYARRVGRGFFYEIGVEEIIQPADFADQADALRAITQRFTAALERIVRRDPDQYLWMHRRWKSVPGQRSGKGRVGALRKARNKENAS